MPDENWQRVREIFDSALRVKPEERQKLISEACGDDEALFVEVDSLLASHDSSESFMETPAVAEIADAIGGIGKKLETGSRLGHYEIVESIGSGGMGEVYLARDQMLDRRVAVKILNEKFSRDGSNLSRFIREAQAASALNHPNILVIHEIGACDDAHFIVSEFIEGRTLREICKDRTLNLSEVLDVSIQIANALSVAHDAHLIHRDIKPENIMIRPDGFVKVLDFGLAKLVEKKNKSFLGLEDSTAGKHHTAKGVILGTVNYMSPEQAKGELVDERTDIFSLGVVIYEMIAGTTPFAGDSVSETFANLINAEPPPLSRFVNNLPEELPRIVSRILRKDKDSRFQTMKGLLADLRELKENLTFDEKLERAASPGARGLEVLRATTGNGNLQRTAETQYSLSQQIKRNKPLAAIAVGVALLALVGLAAIWKIVYPDRNPGSSNMLASLRIKSLVNWDKEAGEGEIGARFSPNGTMIAYSLTKNGQTNIWTKQIPDGKPNPITDGKWNYYNPIWSPNSQRIAFVSNRDDQTAVWTMPYTGGELTQVKAMETNTRLLRWSLNGATIYYQQGFNLFTLDIASKQITQLTNFDESNKAQFFNISPGEDRLAYSAGPNERLQIFVMPLSGGKAVQVTNDETSDEFPFWLPDGNRIIYSSKRDGIFQTSIAYLDQRPTEQINLGMTDTLITDVAADGSKILFTQSREESDLWQARIDGKSETQITSDSGLELWSDASPDGKSIVFQATTESKHLLEGSILIRSISDEQPVNIASKGFSPTFSPDGRKIAFLRDANNLINLWITGRNGADEKQLTTEGIWFSGFSAVPYNRVQVKDYCWSRDGDTLIYCAKKDGIYNIWQVSSDGADQPQQVTKNTDANIKFYCPMFAPDGKRIAYISSPLRPSAGTNATTGLWIADGENSKIVYSSESFFKLIGWGQIRDSLIIAMPKDKPTPKPTKIRLILTSSGNRQTNMALLDAVYFYNIQLSPDGQKIAFATREDGKDNIRVISIGGRGSAKITAIADPTVYVSDIAWSPDSKAVFHSKQKQVGTISMIENFK